MDDRNAALLAAILRRQPVLSLAVSVDGAPVLGLLPFAPAADWSALYVHASRLARHSRGLVEGAGFAALLQMPGTDEDDPFQRPRLTLEGSVHPLAREDPAWAAARDLYLERLPSGAMMFGLGDFTLHELHIERAHFVGGFAAARTVTPDTLRRLAGS